MIEVTPLLPADRAVWGVLAHGYKTFYQTEIPESHYEAAWQRLLQNDILHGAGARLDGVLVGIVHYFYHPHVWMGDVCYLQDLFVAESARGKGAARALIEHVAQAARAAGAARLYWMTQEHNRTARTLYDKVAQFNGFIRYDYPLGRSG